MFFQVLGRFARDAMKRNAPVCVAFSPISVLRMVMITPVR